MPDRRWSRHAAERLSSLTREIAALLTIAPKHVRRLYALPSDDGADPVASARAAYGRRRSRDAVFGRHERVFAEPAWDLMLDLFIATAEGRHVSASAACIGACAPPTTALRCILRLRERGLIAERRHPTDRRVRLIELTSEGAAMMHEYLSSEV